MEEKIITTIHPRDDNALHTNPTPSSSANKENLPEKKTFIKVPKVTQFFATLNNVKIEGDTNWKWIVKIKQILVQLANFLRVKYFQFKKAYTLCYATEYDLQKAADLLKSKFIMASVTIGNFRHDY